MENICKKKWFKDKYVIKPFAEKVQLLLVDGRFVKQLNDQIKEFVEKLSDHIFEMFAIKFIALSLKPVDSNQSDTQKIINLLPEYQPHEYQNINNFVDFKAGTLVKNRIIL